MKKPIVLTAISLVITLACWAQPIAKDYEYKFQVKGLADTVAYLAHYYGPKLYYKDTAVVDGNGKFSFKGEEIEQGMYAVVMPDKASYFELALVEPSFSVVTEKDDLIDKMTIKGSVENGKFYEYLKFISGKNKIAGPIKDSLENGHSEAAKNEAREKMTEMDKEVRAYQEKFKQDNANLFIAKLLRVSDEPEIPETPLIEGTDVKDSTFPRRYYMNHYFDGVDFQDERLIRAPALHKKVERYLNKIVVQHPDSICDAAHKIIDQTIGADEMFKYFVHYITNTYEKSNIMGMDAVFVCVAEDYYTEDKAFWVDSAQIAKIQDAVVTKKPLLIGKKAPNIVLQDTLGKWHILHALEQPYTVLFFWDPGCGHCKKAIPKLQEFYDEYQSKNIEVFAVCTEFETPEWIKFVREKELNWINVSDSPEYPSNFRTVYDIFSTPQLYVLDKDKTIIAKKLGVEQLGEYFDKRLEQDAKQ